MPRHSRTTLGTLLVWYTAWAAVGAATLLLLSLVLHAVDSFSASSVRIAALAALPFLVVAVVIAWARIEPKYRAQQVRAKLMSRGGLSIQHVLEGKRQGKP